MSNTRKAALVCSECGLKGSQLKSFRQELWCVRCIVADIVRRDKLSLGAAVTLAREWGMCTYCGEASAEVEHVIPKHLDLPTWTVPACVECNSLAGGTFFGSFFDKRDGIRELLRKKYAQVLKHPAWHEGDVASMGPTMQKAIRAYTAARRVIDERLCWNIEYSLGAE
jgi:hypothetical protein